MNPFIAGIFAAVRRTAVISSTFERKVRHEAQRAAKTKIGKQSIDNQEVGDPHRNVNFLFCGRWKVQSVVAYFIDGTRCQGAITVVP
jgi:hypothetical protein